MEKNKRFIFIITCMIFVINYSTILGSQNLNKNLNIFVNENNLSYEEIQQLITKLNQIDKIENKKLKKSLRKIGELRNKNKKNNEIKIKLNKIENIKKIDENLSIINLKNEENYLRKRE